MTQEIASPKPTLGVVDHLRDASLEHNPLLRWGFPPSVAPLHLEGRSRAADRTAFRIPELDWVFDAGASIPGRRPDHVFLSHAHADHIHALALLASRQKPPMIHAPASILPLIKNFIDAAWSLSLGEVGLSCEGERYHLHAVTPGDRFEIKRGKARWHVDVIECQHSIECVGYCFREHRRKLKLEHRALRGADIADLRREGVDVMEDTWTPRFAYLGDTTARVFEVCPEVTESPLIIVECSFFEADHEATARRTQHMYWGDLHGIIEAHPHTTFVLIHLSHRNTDEAIARFAASTPPNVVVWTDQK